MYVNMPMTASSSRKVINAVAIAWNFRWIPFYFAGVGGISVFSLHYVQVVAAEEDCNTLRERPCKHVDKEVKKLFSLKYRWQR